LTFLVIFLSQKYDEMHKNNDEMHKKYKNFGFL